MQLPTGMWTNTVLFGLTVEVVQTRTYVSIWRPLEIQSGYFPLGDVATSSHNKPNIPALSVSAVVSDALAAPTGFTEIWNDRGSGANRDVRVMKMNPPSGYTCLGYVAIEGYSSVPNKNLYR